MIAVTENTIASERFDAVKLLREIAPHINGGGGGRPTLAQGGGSNADGLDAALDAARGSVGVIELERTESFSVEMRYCYCTCFGPIKPLHL